MSHKLLKSEDSFWKMLEGDADMPPQLVISLNEAREMLAAETGQSEDVFEAWHLPEWCQLTEMLEEAVQSGDEKLKTLALPLLKQQRQHPAYRVYLRLRQARQDFVNQESPLSVIVDEFTEYKMQLIESAIITKQCVLVEELKGKLHTLIPCKLTYLEGRMTLIAEEVQDHSLVAMDLAEIKNIKAHAEEKLARAGVHEVAEFIRALRSMNEAEVRLVLKIKNPELVTLMPDYQFLGKPTLITNPEGDLIWAAWVEPCDELFDWLMTMDGQVEILEPSDFLMEYIVYCEQNSRKLA
jgi:hypothetical protein